MPKIFWNADELNTIAERYLQVEAGGDSKDKLDLLREAQKQLPTHRRRKLLQWQNAPKSFWVLVEAKRKTNGAAPVAAALPSPKVEAPVEAAIEEAVSKLADELAKVFVARVNFYLKQRLTGILGSAALATVETDRQQKRKVLVLGGMEKDHALLRQDYAKLLDLRFASGLREGEVRQAVDKFDGIVVVWANFIGHGALALITKGTNVVYVNGGLTSLREKLDEIYCM